MRNGAIASLLVVGILAGAGAGYLMGNLNERTVTTNLTFTQVTTSTKTLTVQTVELSRSNGNYSFAIRLNGTTVVKGQELSLFYNLTNISGQYQMVQEDGPLVIPTLYSENGSVAWFKLPQNVELGLCPCGHLPSGFSQTGNLLIPTSNLTAGQKYVLSAGPLIGTYTGPNNDIQLIPRYYSIGESLAINATIAVT